MEPIVLRSRVAVANNSNNSSSVTEQEKKAFTTIESSPPSSSVSATANGNNTGTKQALLACALCALWVGVVWAVMTLSDFLAFKNVWFGVQKSGDDKFWCEHDRTDMLIREPSNSWSDFGFLAVGLFMIFVGVSDAVLRQTNKKNSTDYNSHNLFIEYPVLSIINGLANVFHAFGTFSNHSCRCWNGYQMDVTGMYLVILFPLAYNLIHMHFHRHFHPSHMELLLQINNSSTSSSNTSRASVSKVVTKACGLYLLAGLAFFFTTYIDMDPGIIVLPLVVGILYTTLKVRANAQKFQGKFHNYLFNIAVVMLAVGYTCWLLDRHRVVCFPHSVFQLHAVWHVATAFSLVCVYLYQRSENHPHVKAVFALDSCHVLA
jgi:hypothetical protein